MRQLNFPVSVPKEHRSWQVADNYLDLVDENVAVRSITTIHQTALLYSFVAMTVQSRFVKILCKEERGHRFVGNLCLEYLYSFVFGIVWPLSEVM